MTNSHDIEMLYPVVRAGRAVRAPHGRSRCRPGKLHADKTYGNAELRWRYGMARRRIAPQVQRTTRPSPVEDQTMTAWPTGYHGLLRRHGRPDAT